MSEAHAGFAGGHYAGKETMHKILQTGLWWPTIHMDTKIFCRIYDVFQRTEKTSRHDEMSLVPQITLQEFYKWVIDFFNPISLPRKRTRVCYIIRMTD